MLLPKGEEDKTVPLKIGLVEEDDCFWSSLGNVGDQISAELWRDEVTKFLHNFKSLHKCTHFVCVSTYHRAVYFKISYLVSHKQCKVFKTEP